MALLSAIRMFFLLLTFATSTSSELKTYIVHVSNPPGGHGCNLRQWHESFLPERRSLLYSYRHVISGFAATLNPHELEAIGSNDGFLHVEPNRVLALQTTHTPSFLGLHYPSPVDQWRRTFNYGRGVVIGLLDSGISPTHPSFHDAGMPPPPPKWRGECKFNPATLCNNKLIGARSFENGVETTSPLDVLGHGTHTASTAAGRFVANASVLGSARGTAGGIAPGAHLAMYKVCNATVCQYADVLAGIDSAVADGVDVISMSIVGDESQFYEDVAVGAFGAVRNGVFFAASAGNEGPWRGTVVNTAPWMLTVGAGTTNRRIRAVVKLGNGIELEGESAFQPVGFASRGFLPLVYPWSDMDGGTIFCNDQTSLERAGVRGKIVLCMDAGLEEVEKSKLVKGAGASGLIVMNPPPGGYDTYGETHYLPTSHLSYNDGLVVVDYINTTSNPTATIEFKGTRIGGSTDPAVSEFSARGPSRVNPGILKPDIIGPGVNVLAAWPEPVGPFQVYPPFNILSGTSMSCPHLAGVAALLKSAHPDWSPAMIKSAIMTTADVENQGGRPILDMMHMLEAGVDDMGSGHVNPVRANDPGLVYDIQVEDYIAYLCELNYTEAQVSVIAQAKVDCSKCRDANGADLNYPSFAVALGGFNNWTRVMRRVVTNVGEVASSYHVEVERRPFGVTVAVRPAKLEFGRKGEKQAYTVRFGINGTEKVRGEHMVRTEGLLRWVSSEKKIVVRSPLVVNIGRR